MSYATPLMNCVAPLNELRHSLINYVAPINELRYTPYQLRPKPSLIMNYVAPLHELRHTNKS
jgi:hypothetical protein